MKEITKSVSLKINLGNYQTADLFCAVKAEAEEGKDEEVAKKLHDFCLKEITKDRNRSLKAIAKLADKAEIAKLLESEV